MRLTFAGNNFVSPQRRNIFPLKNPTNSLCAIFSTNAGQLSDSLKSFAGQNKYLQDCRQLCCWNIIFFSKIHRTFVRQTFLQDKMKIYQFCPAVLHFSRRLPKGLRKVLAKCCEKNDSNLPQFAFLKPRLLYSSTST